VLNNETTLNATVDVLKSFGYCLVGLLTVRATWLQSLMAWKLPKKRFS